MRTKTRYPNICPSCGFEMWYGVHDCPMCEARIETASPGSIGSARALVGILVFLGFLLLFTSAILTSPSNVAFNTTDNLTTTVVTGSVPPLTSVCELSGSDNAFIAAIQAFVNVIPGVNCAFGFLSYVYGYATVSTPILWLAIITNACIVGLFYLGV